MATGRSSKDIRRAVDDAFRPSFQEVSRARERFSQDVQARRTNLESQRKELESRSRALSSERARRSIRSAGQLSQVRQFRTQLGQAAAGVGSQLENLRAQQTRGEEQFQSAISSLRSQREKALEAAEDRPQISDAAVISSVESQLGQSLTPEARAEVLTEFRINQQATPTEIKVSQSLPEDIRFSSPTEVELGQSLPEEIRFERPSFVRSDQSLDPSIPVEQVNLEREPSSFFSSPKRVALGVLTGETALRTLQAGERFVSRTGQEVREALATPSSISEELSVRGGGLTPEEIRAGLRLETGAFFRRANEFFPAAKEGQSSINFLGGDKQVFDPNPLFPENELVTADITAGPGTGGRGTVLIEPRQKTFFEQFKLNPNDTDSVKLKEAYDKLQSEVSTGTITLEQGQEDFNKDLDVFINSKLIKGVPASFATGVAISTVSTFVPPVGLAVGGLFLADAVLQRKNLARLSTKYPVGAGLNLAAFAVGGFAGKRVSSGLTTSAESIKLNENSIANVIEIKGNTKSKLVNKFLQDERFNIDINDPRIGTTTLLKVNTNDGRNFVLLQFGKFNEFTKKGIKGDVETIGFEIPKLTIKELQGLPLEQKEFVVARGTGELTTQGSKFFTKAYRFTPGKKSQGLGFEIASETTGGSQGVFVKKGTTSTTSKILKVERLEKNIVKDLKNVKEKLTSDKVDKLPLQELRNLINLERRKAGKDPFTSQEFKDAGLGSKTETSFVSTPKELIFVKTIKETSGTARAQSKTQSLARGETQPFATQTRTKKPSTKEGISLDTLINRIERRSAGKEPIPPNLNARAKVLLDRQKLRDLKKKIVSEELFKGELGVISALTQEKAASKLPIASRLASLRASLKSGKPSEKLTSQITQTSPASLDAISQRSSQAQALGLSQIQAQALSQQQRQRLNLGVSETPSLAQSPLQSQRQQQALRQRLELLQLQQTSQLTTQPTPPTSPPPFIPTTTDATTLKRALAKLAAGKKVLSYDVLVKRGGKFKKVADDLPIGRALERGSTEVRKTLAASYKIVPDTKNKPKMKDKKFFPSPEVFRQFKIRRGKAVPLPKGEFIERRNKRISSGGEIKEILKAQKTGRRRRKIL